LAGSLEGARVNEDNLAAAVETFETIEAFGVFLR
jgi:hypothetical protein